MLQSETPEAPVPHWVNFSLDPWPSIAPSDAGLDAARFQAWLEAQQVQVGKGFAGQKPAGGGAVLARGGCILHEWGDPDYRYQSASLGKTFTRMALQLAVDDGLIADLDDSVCRYWTGEGRLAPHKVLNVGHHAQLTFRHLRDMTGGFPVSNGHTWATGGPAGQYVPGIPPWARWTGDPDYDNYAHVPPGTQTQYSSGGYWRLSQALTDIWKRDLKSLLDERILGPIGIPSDRWQWLTGEEIRRDREFYPELPGYGGFVDPPYEIDGVAVVGGGGWVVAGARDFARLGLLIATGGRWGAKRLISHIAGNAGVGLNMVDGWGLVDGQVGYFSLGRVAAELADPTPEQMASWITGPLHPGPPAS